MTNILLYIFFYLSTNVNLKFHALYCTQPQSYKNLMGSGSIPKHMILYATQFIIIIFVECLKLLIGTACFQVKSTANLVHGQVFIQEYQELIAMLWSMLHCLTFMLSYVTLNLHVTWSYVCVRHCAYIQIFTFQSMHTYISYFWWLLVYFFLKIPISQYDVLYVW